MYKADDRRALGGTQSRPVQGGKICDMRPGRRAGQTTRGPTCSLVTKNIQRALAWDGTATHSFRACVLSTKNQGVGNEGFRPEFTLMEFKQGSDT